MVYLKDLKRQEGLWHQDTTAANSRGFPSISMDFQCFDVCHCLSLWSKPVSWCGIGEGMGQDAARGICARHQCPGSTRHRTFKALPWHCLGKLFQAVGCFRQAFCCSGLRRASCFVQIQWLSTEAEENPDLNDERGATQAA